MDLAVQSAEPLTMSSREIAELVEKRHDSVKRTVVRLGARGVITVPPLVETSFEDAAGKRQTTTEYHIGKRDSFVVVAQLSPEFTARLVDRWQELEERQSQAQIAAIPDFDKLIEQTEQTKALVTTSNQQVAEIGRVIGGVTKNITTKIDHRHETVRAMFSKLVNVVLQEHVILPMGKLASEIAALKKQQAQIVDLAKRAAHQDAIVWTEWLDHDGIYALAKFAPPRRRFLSSQVTKSLDGWCKSTGNQQAMRQLLGKNVWHVAAVNAWLDLKGRDLIRAHCDLHSATTKKAA